MKLVVLPCQLTSLICSCVGIIQLDGYLEPFKDALKSRFSKAQKWIKTIDETEGGMEKFSRVRTYLVVLRRPRH